jgi:Asp/Glu/hydantoin racemase
MSSATPQDGTPLSVIATSAEIPMSLSLLLINPNTSAKTTEMMLAAARPFIGRHMILRGMTSSKGAEMILSDYDLAIASQEVIRIGQTEAENVDCIIIGAFGNPGLEELRRSLSCPVIGIGEAAILEAAANGRRFGIVTTTPDLKASIIEGVDKLLLSEALVGVRITEEDPLTLARNPEMQSRALYNACVKSFQTDGAQAVVIGGGPLSDSAAMLERHFGEVIVQPIPAAIRQCLHKMNRNHL